MSLTEEQIEQIADRMRQCGFDVSDMDNERIAMLAACVIEGLGIDLQT